MDKMGNEKQGQMIVYHLIDLLKQGYRLPAPENCLKEVCNTVTAASRKFLFSRSRGFLYLLHLLLQIHNIMTECWGSDPKPRPTFKALIQRVETVRESKDG